jgi:hypothetical protein
MLRAAILATKKKKQNSLPNPLTTCRYSGKDRT